MLDFRYLAAPVAILGLCVSACMNGDALMSNRKSSSLMAVLHADRPAADRAEALALYGRFIGDWDADVVTYTPEGGPHHGQGEIHFDWILEGRAIQDVWMIPRQKDRVPHAAEMPVAGNWYGTTIRVYDPALGAWRIYWVDPATNSYRQQIGRPQGDDIVQEGTTDTGTLSRWTFTEITPLSFHWKAEASMDNGTSWRLFVEVFAHRRPN